MTPQSFRANPALWQESDNLHSMLALLQHLANDGNVTMALLAADFAEHTLPYAGRNKDAITRCVTAVRAWGRDQTDFPLQECKYAANAASNAADYSANAASNAASSAAYAAYAAYAAANAAAYSANATAYSANAAYAAKAAANATANATANDAITRAEQQWQLAHVRRKHPLTVL